MDQKQADQGKRAYQRKKQLESLLSQLFSPSISQGKMQSAPKLLAVTKGRNVDQAKGLVDSFLLENAGEDLHCFSKRLFLGENRIEELEEKQAFFEAQGMDRAISWGYLGAVQSRKVKRITRYCDAIFSVDSIEKLILIEKGLSAHQRKCDLYLQVNISNQEGRTGFSPSFFEDQSLVHSLITSVRFLQHARLVGVMAIASCPSKVSDRTLYQQMLGMQKIRLLLAQALGRQWYEVELSTGMSEDCLLAGLCGSSLVRAGRILWVD